MPRLPLRAFYIAIVGLGITALLLASNSPLSQWLSVTPLVTNVAAAANLPTVLFAMTGFPGTRAPSDGAVALVAAIQWLVYGFVASWGWGKLRPNNPSKP